MILNSPEAIENERRYTKILQHLKEEFKEADVDNNQYLSKDEFSNFFIQKATDKSVAAVQKYEVIVNDVFQMTDLDSNGQLSLSEFVEGFFKMQRKMIEDIDELTLRVRDVQIREQEIIEKLDELRRSERYTGQFHPKFRDL